MIDRKVSSNETNEQHIQKLYSSGSEKKHFWKASKRNTLGKSSEQIQALSKSFKKQVESSDRISLKKKKVNPPKCSSSPKMVLTEEQIQKLRQQEQELEKQRNNPPFKNVFQDPATMKRYQERKITEKRQDFSQHLITDLNKKKPGQTNKETISYQMHGVNDKKPSISLRNTISHSISENQKISWMMVGQKNENQTLNSQNNGFSLRQTLEPNLNTHFKETRRNGLGINNLKGKEEQYLAGSMNFVAKPTVGIRQKQGLLEKSISSSEIKNSYYIGQSNYSKKRNLQNPIDISRKNSEMLFKKPWQSPQKFSFTKYFKEKGENRQNKGERAIEENEKSLVKNEIDKKSETGLKNVDACVLGNKENVPSSNKIESKVLKRHPLPDSYQNYLATKKQGIFLTEEAKKSKIQIVEINKI